MAQKPDCGSYLQSQAGRLEKGYQSVPVLTEHYRHYERLGLCGSASEPGIRESLMTKSDAQARCTLAETDALFGQHTQPGLCGRLKPNDAPVDP
jgi:hypothetical protein